MFANSAREHGYIGVGWLKDKDLSDDLFANWRDFNHKFIPAVMASEPGKTKGGAGLACGFTWTVVKGLEVGDVVLMPNGSGSYYVGEISGGYAYRPGDNLPHQRPVTWKSFLIPRSAMSLELKRSAGSIGTVSQITQYSNEISALINSQGGNALEVAAEESEEIGFALESQLKEFLVSNWASTELGSKYEIYQEDGEQIGVEYLTDTGRIDILAKSLDGRELLVVELKRGRASDQVVGQIARYMGFVQEELLEPGQSLRGAIIAFEEDPKLRRALIMTPTVDFYRYEVKFKLVK